MLRQNPNNLCQLQELQNGVWVTVFDASLCSITTIPSNQANAQCNLANHLATIVLRRGINDILTGLSGVGSVTSGAAAAADTRLSLRAEGASSNTSLLKGAGILAIVSFVTQVSVSAIQNQLTEQYWIDVTKQLYCALQAGQQLTTSVLALLAFAVEDNIPGKNLINALVVQILRNMNPEGAVQAYNAGTQFTLHDGCLECTDANDLSADGAAHACGAIAVIPASGVASCADAAPIEAVPTSASAKPRRFAFIRISSSHSYKPSNAVLLA